MVLTPPILPFFIGLVDRTYIARITALHSEIKCNVLSNVVHKFIIYGTFLFMLILNFEKSISECATECHAIFVRYSANAL